MKSANNNIIVGNNSDGNNNAIYLQSLVEEDGNGSRNNTIYLNNFSDSYGANVVSVDNATNVWSSPTQMYYSYSSGYWSYLGSYYSDHTLTDTDGDGITDADYDLPGIEPDDQYPLAATIDNYTMQGWWLHSTGNMYESDLGKSPGDIEIAASGGNQAWIADEAAITDTIYPTDIWVGQLAFFAAPGTDSITVEIGSSTGPGNFTALGPEATIGDGTTTNLTFGTDNSSIAIPAGRYLTLRITNNDTSSHALVTGGGWSYVSHTSQAHTLTSYSDDTHNTACDNFTDYGTEHTVYMYSTGLLPSHGYKVVYYDGDNDQRLAHSVTSGASGNVSSQHTFVEGADVAGTWNVIVCEPANDPPSSYDATWSYTITSDGFVVQESAIPEFPTVITAIVAFSLCIVIYLWMRRKTVPVAVKV